MLVFDNDDSDVSSDNYGHNDSGSGDDDNNDNNTNDGWMSVGVFRLQII